ncbi:hypothetical protein F4809DRAFT_642496 [Biscogniauxia mediterranea]|nr:hypothetical protein F4809DRAFT_642496 [Biscogniauxia mediterranea]
MTAASHHAAPIAQEQDSEKISGADNEVQEIGDDKKDEADGRHVRPAVPGFLLLAAFPIWEKYYALVHYFPFKSLMDRTILGSCLLYCFTFLSI